MSELKDKIKIILYRFLIIYHLIFIFILNIVVFFYSSNNTLRFWILFESGILVISCLYAILAIVVINYFFLKSRGKQKAFMNMFLKRTSVIVNNFSHEIRTPLNAILGFADNLYNIETDSSKKEYLQAIRSNSERLFSMSKKIIDYVKVETGQFPINMEQFSNSSLLMDLACKYTNIIEVKGLKFSVENEIPTNYRIKSDFIIMFEILEMLLENAIKFTDAGSIVIKSVFKANTLLYKICDTGCGIADDKKELVFQLYSQENAEMDRNFEGLGLSLTLAKKLVVLLGGKIELEDNVNGGACFIVILNDAFHIIEDDCKDNSQSFIPKNISDKEKEEIVEIINELSENVKVFNPARIKGLGLVLEEKGKHYYCLSKKLLDIAATYNDSDLEKLVKELLMEIENGV